MVDPALSAGLIPSLLDRLVDPESAGTVARPGYTVEQMLRAIHRDIEDLLNTHAAYANVPVDYAELQRSPLTYGVADLRQADTGLAEDRQRVGRILAGIIERFEPRLRDVRVTIAEQEPQTPQRIHFRIDARLIVEPAPPVRFDGFLELKTGQSMLASGEVTP
jgi:type VI secretion system protein ImpF